MPRYAVLRDLDDRDLLPVALVTEHKNRVHVHTAFDRGIRSEYTEPYVVSEPGGHEITYRPGDPEYFDHVLQSLSRTFLLGELEQRETLARPDIEELYLRKVIIPYLRRRAPYPEKHADEPVITHAYGGGRLHESPYEPLPVVRRKRELRTAMHSGRPLQRVA
jgi:hypothetical protein